MVLYHKKDIASSFFEIEYFQNQDYPELEQSENVAQRLLQDQESEEGITCYCGDVKCVIEMKAYRYIV